MTTFQDPPLQSRRAVRQNERDQSPAAVVPTTGPTPTPVAPAAPAEPLTYATQGRSPVPDYDGPGLRARRTPEPVGDVPTDVEPQQDAGVYRPRDYSPEGRRSASPSWAPAYGGAAAEVAAAPADAFASHAPAESAVMPSALDADDPLEHTLTRRELRALRDAHGIAAAPTGETEHPTPEPEQAAPEAVVTPAPAPVQPGTPLAAPSTRLDSAVAEFDQLAAGRPATVPSDPPAPRGRRAAAAMAAAEAEAPVAEAPVAQTPVAETPVAEVPAPVRTAGPAQIAPQALNSSPIPLVAPPVAPEPAPVEPVVVAEIVPQPVAPQPPVEHIVETTIVEATIVDAEPSTATPPTGHWSTQAQLDDETQFGDAQLARNIGSTSGAITTSALVLPSIPSHDFGPLSSGELMVTGTISLPDSLSATGAHPAQLDESDLDHLLDPGDHQVTNTDSQPVRAIKAVSTHTSSRGVIQTVKPRGTRGLTALIIAATGMAVIVGALFIVLVATGQL